MIKNIFLDAGGIILDESTFEEYSAKIIAEIISRYNSNYSTGSYWNDAKEAVYRFVPKVYDYVLYKYINKPDDFNEAKEQYKSKLKNASAGFELTDGIKDFLMIFSTRYKIGILGQYGNDFKKFLEETNILQYFTYTETQDNFNITKPDPRYFEAILKNSGCKAEESIMVGDRIDKDIIPAKMIGMKTIRIRTGIHKTQEPRIPEEIPDLTVDSIKDLKLETVSTIHP